MVEIVVGLFSGFFTLFAVALLIGAYVWYVKIITRRNKALESMSGIDVQLTKRYSLIPNILTIAKRFMEHEKSLLSDITALRSQAQDRLGSTVSQDIADKLEAEAALQNRMGQFWARVENYPELKSDATMVEAQNTYNEVEAQLAAARRFYNATVTEFNNSVQIFPGNLIAAVAKVSAMPFYEVEEAHRAPVNAADYL